MSERLAHVFWLGGSPCSGKSTIADRVSARFGYRLYDCDEAWFRHGEASLESAQPVLHRLARMRAEELWLERSVDQQVREALTSYGELFPLILSDLTRLPSHSPIIAVGAALLPDLVCEIGVPWTRSVWLIPTEDFQRHHYAQRDWRHSVLGSTSDPELAWENWMQRDAAFARNVESQAAQHGGKVIIVDGTRDIDAVEREVLEHLLLADDGHRSSSHTVP